MGIAFDHTTLSQRVLFGTGAAADNALEALEALAASRVMLIAGGHADGVADAIASRIHVVARIADIVQHVPIERADAAAELAESAGADAIVSIGGGSATGLAKIVALRTGMPIVAVPTTFAGSEATDVWGLTESDRKRTGSDPRVLPRAVVYDASLSAGLPGEMAVSSGLNAVAHAVDAFWAPRADPINRALGTESIRALVPGLRRLAADADDIDGREQTLYGAYLAAVAFASAGSGMHHKICHTLGGAYGLPHAQMHAVVLPYVAAFNAEDAPGAMERIAGAIGAPEAASGLFALREELGAPASLAAVGLSSSDIPEAARLILPSIPTSNPRPVTVEDLEELLEAAWEGAPITEPRSE